MIGIQNETPICSNEIFISCPDGTFISEIKDNKVFCNTTGTGFCSGGMPTSCGTTEPLPFSPHGTTATSLSGKCYMLANRATTINPTYWKNWIAGPPVKTPADIIAHVNLLNAEARDEVDCKTTDIPASGTNTALVRDAYTCNNGTWDPQVAHERLGYHSSMPVNVLSTSQPSVMEMNTPFSMTHDPDRTISDHDCWCREDFRVQTGIPCGMGYTVGSGTQNQIEFTYCPSTTDGFWHLYSDLSGCTCDGSGTYKEYPTCLDYSNLTYGGAAPFGSLEGIVTKTWGRQCVGGVSVPDLANYLGTDTSLCICRNKDPLVVTTPCPTGTTNSYLVPGETVPRQNVETVTITNWTCPGPRPDGFPFPGAWGTPDVRTDVPACSCGASPVPDKITDVPCAPNLAGDGTRYRQVYNCATNNWGPQIFVSEDCRPCTWKSSSNPYTDAQRQGPKINSPCSCNTTAVGVCHDNASAGLFNIWDSCRCTVNDRI
jgi:hypothetical protein